MCPKWARNLKRTRTPSLGARTDTQKRIGAVLRCHLSLQSISASIAEDARRREDRKA